MNYVPILKVRKAEMSALHVTPRDALQPLLELMPLPLPELGDEDQEQKSAKTLEEHLLLQLKMMTEKWGTEPVMVDFQHLLASSPGAAPQIRAWADDAQKEGVRLIPTIPLNGSAARIALARYIAQNHRNGFALRVTGVPDNWGNLVPDAQAVIDLMDVGIGDIDLVVDLGDIHKLSVSNLATGISVKLPPLLKLGKWRTVTVAAGGYPDSNPKADDVLIPRADAQLWRQLRRMMPDIAAQVQFGDYGVDNPKFGLTKSRTLNTLLKYTLNNDWWFLRERGTPGAELEGGQKGKGQKGDFRNLCKRLIADPRYMTASYSWGDNWLEDRASAPNSGGGAERRQAMFSHHFMVALSELGGTAGAVVPPATPAGDELPF